MSGLRQQLQRTMGAAIFHGPNKITIEEIQIPTKGIILKVNACAVCGYDARVFRNGHSKVKPPIILGHEICGEVLERVFTCEETNMARLGTIEAGTRVVVCPIIPCLTCGYCLNGNYNLCLYLKEIGSTVNGGFAEYVYIPDQTIKIDGLVEVPANLTNDEAVLLEPLACCLNGFSTIGHIVKGKTSPSVVIIGDGPIGLTNRDRRCFWRYG